MLKSQKLHKDVLPAIQWAAAEYKYVAQLEEELAGIDEKTNISDESKKISKAISIMVYVSKAEKRAAKFEEKVKRDLEAVYQNLSENLAHGFFKENLMRQFRETLEKISIEERELIHYASRYKGLLHEDLAKASAEIQLLSDIEEKNPQKAEAINGSLIQLIEKITEEAKDADRWVKSLLITLQKAKEICDVSLGIERSKTQEIFDGPYMGKLQSYSRETYGTTYLFRTKLGVVTKVFVPYREFQDLDPRTIKNFKKLLYKTLRRVYGNVFGTIKRPVKTKYGISEGLFPDNHLERYPGNAGGKIDQTWYQNHFRMDGVLYFAKLGTKSADDSIGHVKRNIFLADKMRGRKPNHFELINPPYVFATARYLFGKKKKHEYSVLMSEARTYSLHGIHFTKSTDGQPRDDIENFPIYQQCYKELIKKEGIQFSEFIELLKLAHKEIRKMADQIYESEMMNDPEMGKGGLDYELSGVFIRGYNPLNKKLILSFLDQTH